MSDFTLSMRTDNASFGETTEDQNAEIARLLEKVTRQLNDGLSSGKLFDSNGNAVGYWQRRN